MKLHPILFLIFSLSSSTAQTLQLAPPQTPQSRIFASPGLKIAFDFRLQDAEIRYTTDGSEPTENDKIFTTPIAINDLVAIVKAKSFKPRFLPSETTTVQVLPYQSCQIDSINMTPTPKKHMANGWKTLTDKRLGDSNFKQNWLGFDSTIINLAVDFSKKQRLSHIAIGFLRQQKSWIFLPAAIEVYDAKGKLLTSQHFPDEAKELPNSAEIISLDLSKHRYKSLKIKLIALPTLPEWHSGASNSGWLFLDEVMVW
ncbi:MAG: hypothetical protein GC192_06595 [Bacteroidetes bacterium]|nr:hypothetical protein [Bacteroidota bacterium]